jgi:hypothetical protein
MADVLDLRDIADEWEAYIVDIDEEVEFTLLTAISVDDTEGWNSGYDDDVIDSKLYILFAE